MGLRTVTVAVGREDPLYPFLLNISRHANNLYNASLFRLRQILTALQKDPARLTDNEKEVLKEIDTLLAVKPEFRRPTKENPFVGYPFLYHLLYVNENPDYLCDGFPRQTGQQIIKNAVRDMTGFFRSKADYRKHPEKYYGEPKLPNYRKSGGLCTFYFTNQQVWLDDEAIHFPGTKITAVKPKNIKPEWTLKQVNAVPGRGMITLHYVFEDHEQAKEKKEPSRIVAIDLGVTNFAAVTNNIGKPGILFKGGWLKHINCRYNRKMSIERSRQTKGTTNPFRPTAKTNRWGEKRSRRMNDYMHKAAKVIVDYCLENEIDTVVTGDNRGWKQAVNMGTENNREFVTIPHSRFKQILSYLCEWNGLNYVEQEESYTSQASYPDLDEIPVYQAGCDTEYTFSGKRNVRGTNRLYRCGDGKIVNADLNGSANIGRKAFPELYRCDVKKTLETIRVYRTMQELNAAGK